MRINRTNFGKSSNELGQGEGDRQPGMGTRYQAPRRPEMDEIAAREIEGRGELPVWQDAFTLGPNVRFSRTPEAALTRKTPVEMPVAPAIEPPREMGAAVTSTVEATPPVLVSEGNLAVAQSLPQEIHPTGARAITFRLRQEFESRHPAGVRQAIIAHPVSEGYRPAPGQSGSAPLGRLIDALTEGLQAPASEPAPPSAPMGPVKATTPYLSDYAFWEAVAMTSEEEPVLASRNAPSAWRNQEILKSALRAPASVEAYRPAAPTVGAASMSGPSPAEEKSEAAFLPPRPLPVLPRYPTTDGAVATLYREIPVKGRAEMAAPAVEPEAPAPQPAARRQDVLSSR